MIVLTNEISKAEFLKQLSNEVGYPGVLNIQADVLPSFLDNQVALTIFSYQLSNYPREIVWSSSNPIILQLLRDSQLNISENYLKPHFPSEEISEVVPTNSNLELPSDADYEVIENWSDMAIDTSYLAKTGFFQNNALEVIPNLNLESNFSSKIPTTLVKPQSEQHYVNGMDKELSFSPSSGNTLNTISLAGLLTQEKYQPSSVIKLSQEDILEEELQGEKVSLPEAGSLDSWLEKIEATREALNSLRKEKEAVNENLFNNLPNFARPRTRSKWFYTITASSIISLLIVSFLIFFPTQAYTLEVYPDYQDGTFILESSKSDLSKKDILLESKQTIPTQNKEKTETERAVGTIKLINEGGKDVVLDNAKFQLVKDGFRYSPIYNSTLPTTFSITAQNNKTDNAPQFTIQSIPQIGVAGSTFNQAVGTRLKIINLQDQSPCSSCYAVVTADITNKNGEGNKIVTEADYDSLKNVVEQELQKSRNEKIQSIRADKVFIGKNWYKDVQNSYVFSAKVGEKAENISLAASINSEVYYTLRSAVEDKIRQENPEIDKIKDMALLGSEGSLDSQGGIKSNFYYTFSKKVKVDSSEVSNMLAAKEFDQARSDITKEYPSVKRIEKQDLGIKLPGLTPRTDIKIIEKDS